MTFDLNTQMPRIGERAEILAAWYLRFNGFFPLPNFILHDAGATKLPGQQLTEADVLAIRLPFTKEVIEAPDGRICTLVDPQLDVREGVTEFLVAEVCSEGCKFNWLDKPEDEQRLFFSYVLRRFGFWPDKEIAPIVGQLIGKQFWGLETTRIRLMSFGAVASKSDTWPQGVVQATLLQTLGYFHQLFSCYGKKPTSSDKCIVSDHKQWHPMIREIYNRLLGHKQTSQDPPGVYKWLFP